MILMTLLLFTLYSLIVLHSLHSIHYFVRITLDSLYYVYYIIFVTLQSLKYIAFITLHSLHYIWSLSMGCLQYSIQYLQKTADISKQRGEIPCQDGWERSKIYCTWDIDIATLVTIDTPMIIRHCYGCLQASGTSGY